MSPYAEARRDRAEHAEGVLSSARLVERCASGEGRAVCTVTGHARRIPVLFLSRYICRPGSPIKDHLVYGKCVRCGDGEDLHVSPYALEVYWREALGWPGHDAEPSALARYLA